MRIVKKTLSEQIYESLKEDIVSQKIKSGEKLINRDLQLRFGVSSTPIRDAINRLYQDGLLGDITNVGSQVINFDLAFALEVNEMVGMLNCSAIHIAAGKGKIPQVAKQLERILKKQEACKDSEAYFSLDGQFHQTFFDYSNNKYLIQTHSRFRVLEDMLIRYLYEFRNRQNESLAQHHLIYSIFQRGDIAGAHEQMRQHYLTAAEIFRQYLT